MFFYISFLRPPPTQVSLHDQILITPQVSNDLRTESYESSQDIYYSWAPYPQTHLQSSISSAPTLKTTKPAKLTTYRSSSAYKEIPVPTPPGVREGQQWELILSSSDRITEPNYTINLCWSDVGKEPLPVISMPILFSGRGLRGNIKKQERIKRIYQISAEALNPPSSGEEQDTGRVSPLGLTITEQLSFDLDKKIWDSGIGLSSWLLEFKTAGQTHQDELLQNLWESLFSTEPRNIVELGAGTGIVSLTVASLRFLSGVAKGQGDRIIITDLESAIPLINHNISSNLALYPHNSPEAAVLDWDDENLPDPVAALENIDMILMSDVTYNTASFPALLSTISRLLARGTKPPVILMGYKERDEGERSLWDMIEGIGVRLEKIGMRLGFAEPAVEIWAGLMKSSASVATGMNRVV